MDPFHPDFGQAVRMVRFSPDGRHIVGIAENRLTVSDNPRVTPVALNIEHRATDIRHLAFRPDGTQFVTCDAQGRIQLWDTSSATPLGQLAHIEQAVVGLNLSQNGKQLHVICRDGTVRSHRLDPKLPEPTQVGSAAGPSQALTRNRG